MRRRAGSPVRMFARPPMAAYIAAALNDPVQGDGNVDAFTTLGFRAQASCKWGERRSA